MNFKRLFGEQINAFFITGRISLMAEPGIRHWEMWDFISLLIRLHLTGGYPFLSGLFLSKTFPEKKKKQPGPEDPVQIFTFHIELGRGRKKQDLYFPSSRRRKELSKLKVFRKKIHELKWSLKVKSPDHLIDYLILRKP